MDKVRTHTVITLSKVAKQRVDELSEKLDITVPLLLECLVMMGDENIKQVITTNLAVIKAQRTADRLAKKETRNLIKAKLEKYTPEQMAALLAKLEKEA